VRENENENENAENAGNPQADANSRRERQKKNPVLQHIVQAETVYAAAESIYGAGGETQKTVRTFKTGIETSLVA